MGRQALPTITASGDPYAIGRALGEAAAPALRDVAPTLARFRALMREWSGSDRVRSLEAAARAAWPQYMREIEGIADGAGVAFDTLFLWNCRGDLPESGDRSRGTGNGGCTTLMVPPGDGRAGIIAHNQDDAPELHGLCHLVDVRPDRAPGFVGLYVPGLLPGHSFAVNRAGLVQAVDDLYHEVPTAGAPRHLVCRAVLDCGGLDDAMACIRDSERASGFHHALGCAGDARLLSVEAPASGCSVVEVGAPRAHANHLLDARLVHDTQVIEPSSRSRQERAEELIDGGGMDEGGPLRVLGDVGASLPIHRRERDAGESVFTLATAVFRISGIGVDCEVFDDILRPPVHREEVRPDRTEA